MTSRILNPAMWLTLAIACNQSTMPAAEIPEGKELGPMSDAEESTVEKPSPADVPPCAATEPWPDVAILGPAGGATLAYEDGTLWENGTTLQKPTVSESLSHVCRFREGQAMQREEVLVRFPLDWKAYEFEATMQRLGFEGYFVVQVQQGDRRVRFGVAPFHPETPVQDNDDVLVIYKWSRLQLAIVRGEDRKKVAIETSELVDGICSESLRGQLRSICEKSTNECQKVHLILEGYDSVTDVISLMAVLDSAVPTNQLRVFGVQTIRRPLSEDLASFPSYFALDLYKGSPCK